MVPLKYPLVVFLRRKFAVLAFGLVKDGTFEEGFVDIRGVLGGRLGIGSQGGFVGGGVGGFGGGVGAGVDGVRRTIQFGDSSR